MMMMAVAAVVVMEEEEVKEEEEELGERKVDNISSEYYGQALSGAFRCTNSFTLQDNPLRLVSRGCQEYLWFPKV